MASSSPALSLSLSDSAEKGKFYYREPVTANNGEFMERDRDRERSKYEGKNTRSVFLLVIHYMLRKEDRNLVESFLKYSSL